MSTEKKIKKVKELFVQDLARFRGGEDKPPPKPPKCPEYTTQACGEEPNDCSAC
ncbi:hypothetical protein ACLESD_46350 [Pyxidicoccus sp. 3LFB2]